MMLHQTCWDKWWNEYILISAVLELEQLPDANNRPFFMTVWHHDLMKNTGVNNELNDGWIPCSCFRFQGLSIVSNSLADSLLHGHGLRRYLNRTEPSLLPLCSCRRDKTKCLLWKWWSVLLEMSNVQVTFGALSFTTHYVMDTHRTAVHSVGSSKLIFPNSRHASSLTTAEFTTVIFTSVKCGILRCWIVSRRYVRWTLLLKLWNFFLRPHWKHF